MKRFLLCVVLVVGMAGPAVGAYVDGNFILRTCRDKTDNEKQAFCMGYVGGVSDTSDTVAASYTGAAKVCKPAGVTLPQIADLAIAWLKANPSKRHFSASTVVVIALVEAFPCKK